MDSVDGKDRWHFLLASNCIACHVGFIQCDHSYKNVKISWFDNDIKNIYPLRSSSFPSSFYFEYFNLTITTYNVWYKLVHFLRLCRQSFFGKWCSVILLWAQKTQADELYRMQFIAQKIVSSEMLCYMTLYTTMSNSKSSSKSNSVIWVQRSVITATSTIMKCLNIPNKLVVKAAAACAAKTLQPCTWTWYPVLHPPKQPLNCRHLSRLQVATVIQYYAHLRFHTMKYPYMRK